MNERKALHTAGLEVVRRAFASRGIPVNQQPPRHLPPHMDGALEYHGTGYYFDLVSAGPRRSNYAVSLEAFKSYSRLKRPVMLIGVTSFRQGPGSLVQWKPVTPLSLNDELVQLYVPVLDEKAQDNLTLLIGQYGRLLWPVKIGALPDGLAARFLRRQHLSYEVLSRPSPPPGPGNAAGDDQRAFVLIPRSFCHTGLPDAKCVSFRR